MHYAPSAEFIPRVSSAISETRGMNSALRGLRKAGCLLGKIGEGVPSGRA